MYETVIYTVQNVKMKWKLEHALYSKCAIDIPNAAYRIFMSYKENVSSARYVILYRNFFLQYVGRVLLCTRKRALYL